MKDIRKVYSIWYSREGVNLMVLTQISKNIEQVKRYALSCLKEESFDKIEIVNNEEILTVYKNGEWS